MNVSGVADGAALMMSTRCGATITDDKGHVYTCALYASHDHEHVDGRGDAWWQNEDTNTNGPAEAFNIYERLFESSTRRFRTLVPDVEFNELSDEQRDAFIAFVDLIANEVRGRIELRAKEGEPLIYRCACGNEANGSQYRDAKRQWYQLPIGWFRSSEDNIACSVDCAESMPTPPKPPPEPRPVPPGEST